MYVGSWKIDDLLTFSVITTRVDTGAATDADAVPSYRVYEDETSTPILTGNMALLDSANTAGFYTEQITLSAANGFEKGKSYNIYIQATVNSVVGATVRNFQIEAEVDANSVSNIGTGVITAAAIADGAIDAGAIAADAITAAKIADGAIDAATFAAGAITATVIATGAIDADAVAADAVTEIQSGLATAAALDTVDNFLDTEIAAIITTLGTPAGASLAADIAAIEAQTDDIGAAGAGLTAVPWNASWDAEVQSEVEDAILVHRLDELLNADSDIDGAAPPTVGSVFHELMSKTAGSFTFDQTTDSNEAIRDNMGTAQTGDSFARLGAPAGASVSADIAAIEAQTDDIGAAGAGLTAVPWNASWDAEVQSEVQDALDAVVADSVPADGSRPSIAQGIYMLVQFLLEKSVSGTTVTVKKPDGSTTLFTLTLNDATTPTSVTRTT